MLPAMVQRISICKKSLISITKGGSSEYGRNMSQSYVVAKVISLRIIKGSFQTKMLVKTNVHAQGGAIDIGPSGIVVGSNFI